MARPHPALRALAAGRSPGPGLGDVDGLVASAVDHGMQGLLWSYVRDHAPDLPDRLRLAGIDAATRQRHARLWAATTAVRDRLHALAVPMLAVKGVTAEARWYGRVGERPATDVDVLVGPAGCARAGDVLRALDPGHPLVDSIDALVCSGAVQSADLRLDGVAVDLHFDLLKLGYPMRDPSVLWGVAHEVEAPDGSAVRVLDPAAALVHFLVHANKDGFPRLLGYADVARVLRDPDLDRDAFRRIVRDEGLDTVVGCALATVTRALDLPPAVAEVPAGARARVWHVVWPERVTLLGSSGPARSRRQEVVPFLVRGRLADAVRSAARVVAPAPAAVAQVYADIPGPYPVRLARGRLRSRRARRDALRSRRAAAPGDAAPSPVDGATKAGLLRRRLADEPLWLDVTGTSMGRSIPGGARVRVVAGTVPRRGEVWAFCTPEGAIVVHRCRGTGGAGHRFQGDACIRADAPVADDRLVGRVVEIAPARHPLMWSAPAGAVQRMPRELVAAAVVATRRVRGTAR